MTIRNLRYLFAPASVAVIGASLRPHSIGTIALNNMMAGGFTGPIYPVNPKYESLAGMPVYPKIARLPQVPDLALICTPPKTVPGLIRELGERGTRAAIVLSDGFPGEAKENARLRQAMLDAARPHLLRILGPDSVGLLVPGIGLNASIAHTGALPGKIAFVSQSGALVSAILDWAKSRGIGFSTFISLGEGIDTDVGDILDYLAGDADTHAILLYIEDIRAARKFMSAARAAARGKPVLVLKAGRVTESAQAAGAHAGALVDADAVYDAAIRRAGMLRVFSTEDLFDAVETLARARPMPGNRLAIVANGGAPGVLATDALIAGGGELAQLSDATVEALDAALPPAWSRSNPVNIFDDASPQRYTTAVQALLHEPNADAVLFIHAPTARVPSLEIASAVAPLAKLASRNILACWLGGESVAAARTLFTDAAIPTYDTPEDAVRGFMQIAQYQRNQNLLMQVPASAREDVSPDRARAQAVIRQALEAGRESLTEPEAKSILAAYGMPVVDTRVAADADEAARIAGEIGFPVALKILSHDIGHKSDVGGVALGLQDAASVSAAATAMRTRVAQRHPGAQLRGYAVQAMAQHADTHELSIGVSTDPVFGPVILFGQGGIAAEVTADYAVGLPPLNMVLARDMISRTRVSRLLNGYRNHPAIDVERIARTLVDVSYLITEIPQIVELDINPLLADAQGVLVLDARIRLGATNLEGADRFAIRPYPSEQEEWIDWHGQALLLRPIKPEDGDAHIALFNALAPEDVRFRFFAGLRSLAPSQLARLTQIDYGREMAFIATRKRDDGVHETLGVARIIADPDNVRAEFAIAVRSDLKGKGLGPVLMRKLIAYSKSRGLQELIGEALPENHNMLNLAIRCGFAVNPAPDGDTMLMKLDLAAAGKPA